MRAAATVLGALTFGCGAGPSDVDAYRQALVTAKSFEQARSACATIEETSTRGDCQVTITERFERLDPADCGHVTDPVWLDECRFLLAERMGKTGNIERAITICNQSRFRRHCSWHLLQDGVEATLDESAQDAEAVLEFFGQIDALKDAPFQFWRIRWREWAGMGRSADEADCQGLRHQRGCEEALERHVSEMLHRVSRTDPRRVCAMPRGQRVHNRATPGWVLGPITTRAEAAWEAEWCIGVGLQQPDGSGSR